MLRVFEAESVGDFADGQAGLDKQLLRTFDDRILYVALGGGAALLADEVAEVVGRQAGLVCKIGDSRQTVSFRMAAIWLHHSGVTMIMFWYCERSVMLTGSIAG